jgi:FkbM family methyltransferase
LNRDLPLGQRLQFRVIRGYTGLLRLVGLREQAWTLRLRVSRGWRRLFERLGSDRYSHPALHGIDRKLDRLFDRHGGFFVEAGGFDGYRQSNTYYLERFRGWRGVLVEPMSELAREARLNRPTATVIQCALVGSGYPEQTIEMEFGDLMSSVSGLHESGWTDYGFTLGWQDPYTEQVPARSLGDVLGELGSPQIDLLSLDVEGYESQVLTGLDLDRHAPMWILIEMHDLATGRRQMAPILGARYVEHAQLSPMDVLYRRRDVPPPAAVAG